MKDFNLEEAKAGKPVCTRDGREVKILDFEFNYLTRPEIVAKIKDEFCDILCSYYIDGKPIKKSEPKNDLMMKGEKMEGWINLYHNGCDYYECSQVFKTKENAINDANRFIGNPTATVKIEWEE